MNKNNNSNRQPPFPNTNAQNQAEESKHGASAIHSGTSRGPNVAHNSTTGAQNQKLLSVPGGHNSLGGGDVDSSS